MAEDKILEALKVGVAVKRNPLEGGHNVFRGDELSAIYYDGEYCLTVRYRSGLLKASEYGTDWLLAPEYCELYDELFLENAQ